MSPALRGRAAELAAARALIDAGSGSLAFTGGPGLGKTALLEAAAAYAGERGTRVLWLRGDGAETGLPYAGLHALLQPLEQAAGLRALLEEGPPAPALRLHSTVLGLLAAARPVLCCVDDADLVDEPSRHVLGFAARRAAVAVLSAGTGPLPGPGRRLGPLGAVPMAELLGDLPPGVAGAVAAASAGNPLAAVEMAGALTAGQLKGTEPPPAHPPRDGRLWRGLSAALAALPGAARDVLLLVAAEPGLRTDTLIRAAVPLGDLEPAEAAGLVAAADGRLRFRDPLMAAVVYDEAPLSRRRDAHRLLGRVLDGDSDVLRRAWHRAAALDEPAERLAAELDAAAALARAFATPAEVSEALERAAELTGDHREKAARLAAAARAAWLAGRPHRAQRLLAGFQPLTTDAGARAQAGLVRGDLELRGGVPAHARDELLAAASRFAGRDRFQAVRTLMRAGEASYMAGDHRRYLAVARQAAALRRSDDPVSAQLMYEYLDGISATFQARHLAAAGPLRRVLELTSSADSPAILVWASVAALLLGEDAQALKLSGQALSTARDHGSVAAVPQIIDFLVHAQLWMGDYAGVSAGAIEGLRLAEETGQANTAAQHLASLALVSAVQGDEEACRLRASAALKAAAAHRMGMVQARSAWALAHLDLAAGRPEAAASRLRGTAWNAAGQGHLVVQVMATPNLVEAAVRTGDLAGAEAALTVFERWAGSTGNPDRLALAARCRALLAPAGDAAEQYAWALDLHDRGLSGFERARTQLLFGAALRRDRRRRDSRSHLHGALETFERLGAAAWAERARVELRASGEPVGRSREAPAGDLTAQQLEIARLAAAGATNREIAARLYISHRTVEYHLGKIFTKLEIRSRVELTRLLP